MKKNLIKPLNKTADSKKVAAYAGEGCSLKKANKNRILTNSECLLPDGFCGSVSHPPEIGSNLNCSITDGFCK